MTETEAGAFSQNHMPIGLEKRSMMRGNFRFYMEVEDRIRNDIKSVNDFIWRVAGEEGFQDPRKRIGK
jgi:hypothetical protein